MSRAEAWLVHVANLLVVGTGIAYAVVRYLLEPPDPFSAVHPAQPAIQHAHVWTAPLLVFALGAIWRSHALACTRLGVRARHKSGLVLMLGAVSMALSGYFLQTAVEPAWRTAWIWVHVAASLLWIAATLAHQLAPRPERSPFERAEEPPPRR